MSDDTQVIQRALSRERKARKLAEDALELRQSEFDRRTLELQNGIGTLREYVALFEEAMDVAPVAVVTVDETGTIFLFNREAQRMFRCVPKSVLGTSLRPLVPSVFSKEQPDRIREDLCAGNLENMDCDGKRQNGTAIKLCVSSRLSRPSHPIRITFYISPQSETAGTETISMADEPNTSVDIRSLVRFLGDYERLRESSLQSQSTTELLERVDVLVHSLVTGQDIHPPAFAAESAEPESPRPIGPVDVPRRKKVVQPRHQFSARAKRVEHSVNEIVQGAIDALEDKWKPVADMSVDLYPELPNVAANRDALHEVFTELVEHSINAILEAVCSGRYSVGRITVTTQFNTEWIQLKITNDGVGIPSQVCEHITSGAVSTDNHEGEQHSLVECHNRIAATCSGFVAVHSDVHTGTTFEVLIPWS